jgi:Glycosyltransferase family 87
VTAPRSGLVLPSADDPVVGGAVEAIGGRPGRYARLGDPRFGTPVRWLVALTLLTSLLGLWQKSPCRVHPWADEYQYTRACYTDVFALYFAEGLGPAGAGIDPPDQRPYLEHPVEYPVGIGATMAVAAKIVHIFPEPERPRRFYDVTWALLTICAVAVTVTTARLAGRRRIWDAAMVALAPALLLHGTTNWDLVAVALAGFGMVRWARRDPVGAGLLLGLATATKLYPVLLLLPVLVLCVRTGRLKEGVYAAVALVLAAAAVTVPVYLASPSFAEVGGVQTRVADSPLARFGDEGLAALAPHTTAEGGVQPVALGAGSSACGTGVTGTNAVYRFVELNAQRPADWDSLWYALSRASGPLDPPSACPSDRPARLNAVVAITTVLLLGLVVMLALWARRRPRLAQLAFLTVVAFLLPNKVFSPQYVLWLVPLAVLARPRWGPFLAWQATEVAVLLTRFWFFIGNDAPGKGIGYGPYVTAVLLRDVALVGLCALVVRDVLRPEDDVVRADGVDDPAGGVLDGAPDRSDRTEQPDRDPVPA